MTTIHKKFFDTPTQVAFYDCDADEYVGGIAFEDKIICGCCGAVIDIQDLIDTEEAALENDWDIPHYDPEVGALHIYDEWEDISHFITG